MGFLIIITQTEENDDIKEVVASEISYKEALDRAKRLLGEPLIKSLSASLCGETPISITIAKQTTYLHLQEDC